MRSTPASKTIVRVSHYGVDQESLLANVSYLTALGITFQTDEDMRAPVGSILDTTIVSDGEEVHFKSVLVEQSENRFTARFIAPDVLRKDDRRESHRWNCPINFLPLAVAAAPGRFNEFMSFRVRNISRGGLELQTEVEGSFLLKGMLLRLNISLPMVGDTFLTLKVLRIQGSTVGGREVLRIGGEIVEMEKTSQDLIGSYLYQFSDIDSAEQFAKPGRHAKHLSGVDYSFAKHEEEYAQLIVLAAANDEAKRILSQIEGRIVLGRARESLLAVGIVSHPVNERNSETGQARPDEAIRLTNLLIMTNQQSNVVFGLVRFLATASLTCQRPYLVVNGAEELDSILASMGFRQSSQNSRVRLAHPTEVLLDGRTNPFIWNLVWRKSAEYIAENSPKAIAGLTGRMFRIYKTFGLASRIYYFFVNRLAKMDRGVLRARKNNG